MRIAVEPYLGVNNALVATAGNKTLVISGRENAVRNKKTRKTRSRLQKKLSEKKVLHTDTHSVRRVLKRLSRKQRNRNDSFCKESAAKLVKWAPKDSVLVFEDLRVKPVAKSNYGFRKGTRRRMNQWFFSKITQAAANRAEREGVGIAFVDPAYTSQICHACGLLGNRNGPRFSCPHCGHADHADHNASLNILTRFAVLRSGGPRSTGPEAQRLRPGKPPG